MPSTEESWGGLVGPEYPIIIVSLTEEDLLAIKAMPLEDRPAALRGLGVSLALSRLVDKDTSDSAVPVHFDIGVHDGLTYTEQDEFREGFRLIEQVMAWQRKRNELDAKRNELDVKIAEALESYPEMSETILGISNKVEVQDE